MLARGVRRLIVAAIAGALLLLASPNLGFPTGPPLGLTGAPGELTCNDCHADFPLNSGNGSVSISGSPALFLAGYLPGVSYTVNVTVDKFGQKRWGFEMTALLDSNDTRAGTLSVIDATRTQVLTGGNGRQYAMHCCGTTGATGGDGSGGAGTPGPFSWSVRWQAPSKGKGAVSFYAAGNTASNDNTAGGDWIYTTKRTATEDTVGPTVAVTSPAANSTLNGTVAVVADASDPNGISKVDFLVDGALSATDTSPPYRWDWDTGGNPNGPHVLSARAFDAAANNRSASVPVTVGNDKTPPTVKLLAPPEGAVVNSTVRVVTSATDNDRLAKVAFFLDGALQQENTSGATPFSWDWDTQSSFNGPHVILARATDASGLNAESTVNVTVDNQVNDTTPPQVRFLSPNGGASVSGNARVEAEASDDRKLVLVLFRVDQTSLASFSAPPFEASWNTRNFTNGPHLLNATAVDQAGNRNWSEITVTVDNDVVPPVVSIGAPGNGSRVAGVMRILASATDDKGVVSFVLRVDGTAAANASGPGPQEFDWDTANSSNGAHAVEVAARDAAGNEGRSIVTLLVVNLAAPVIVDPAPGAEAGAQLRVAGTADPLALSVEVRVDGGEWSNASGTSAWSAILDTSTLAPGPHNVKVRAWSGAGHTPVAQVSFNVVRIAPPLQADPAQGLPVVIAALALSGIGLFIAFSARGRARSSRGREPDRGPKE